MSSNCAVTFGRILYRNTQPLCMFFDILTKICSTNQGRRKVCKSDYVMSKEAHALMTSSFRPHCKITAQCMRLLGNEPTTNSETTKIWKCGGARVDPVILSTRSFEETGNLLSAYLVKFSGALDSAHWTGTRWIANSCEAESFSLFEKYDCTHYIIDW